MQSLLAGRKFIPLAKWFQPSDLSRKNFVFTNTVFHVPVNLVTQIYLEISRQFEVFVVDRKMNIAFEIAGAAYDLL